MWMKKSRVPSLVWAKFLLKFHRLFHYRLIRTFLQFPSIFYFSLLNSCSHDVFYPTMVALGESFWCKQIHRRWNCIFLAIARYLQTLVDSAIFAFFAEARTKRCKIGNRMVWFFYAKFTWLVKISKSSSRSSKRSWMNFFANHRHLCHTHSRFVFVRCFFASSFFLCIWCIVAFFLSLFHLFSIALTARFTPAHSLRCMCYTYSFALSPFQMIWHFIFDAYNTKLHSLCLFGGIEPEIFHILFFGVRKSVYVCRLCRH